LGNETGGGVSEKEADPLEVVKMTRAHPEMLLQKLTPGLEVWLKW
jgi:hypothetical protein